MQIEEYEVCLRRNLTFTEKNYSLLCRSAAL